MLPTNFYFEREASLTEDHGWLEILTMIPAQPNWGWSLGLAWQLHDWFCESQQLFRNCSSDNWFFFSEVYPIFFKPFWSLFWSLQGFFKGLGQIQNCFGPLLCRISTLVLEVHPYLFFLFGPNWDCFCPFMPFRAILELGVRLKNFIGTNLCTLWTTLSYVEFQLWF